MCSYIYNVTGFAGIVWFVAWIFLISNIPADHPRISPKEQHYIESSIHAELSNQATSNKVNVWLS